MFPSPDSKNLIPIIMPQLGESIAEATIIRAAFSVGDRVEADTDLLEVETNKAVMGVTAPCGGILKELTAAIDESRSRRESAEESGAEDDDVAEHVVVDDGIEICEDNDDDVDNRSFGVAFEAVAFGLTDDDALASIDLMMFTLI